MTINILTLTNKYYYNMKMKSLSKITLLAALLCGGANAAWADEVLPTPVYFNDFSFATSGKDGIEIVGNGVFEDESDPRFGKVFHNDPGETPSKAIRTNYLKLPDDVLSHSTETKEITIGFWVNVKNAADYWFSPIFSAYGLSPAANAEASHEGNNENWPVFVLQSRGFMQLNNGGWDNFEAADNVKGANQESTVWLDDKAWHYYTMTMTTSSAKIYVDGEIFNEWNIAGTEGHYVEGFFTYGGNYKYICLGGNQAWNWGDSDPAYAFDDVAIYNKALTKAQIDRIRANKLDRTVTGTAIGAIDNSTEYLGALSTKMTLKPGESYHYSFINYNKGENNYNNWILPVYDATDTRVITVRADNWEDMHHVGETWGSNAGCISDFNWANFPGELNGATIDMTVTFTKEKVFQMTSKITTVSGQTWNYSYSNDYTESPISLTSNEYIKVALSVSRSWLDLLLEGYYTTISEYGWSTFSSDYALDFSKATDGLTAYMITGVESDNKTVTLSKVTGTVPAGTGLLLNGTENTSYNIPIVGSSTTDVSNNKLVAGTGASISSETGYTKYVLSVNGTKAEFQKINAVPATVAKGKAYLQFTGDVPAPVLNFGSDNLTSINEVRSLNTEGAEFFNLKGQRVANPTKGLYIANGKKVIIK